MFHVNGKILVFNNSWFLPVINEQLPLELYKKNPWAKKETAFKRKQTVCYVLPFRNQMVAAHDSIVVERDSTMVCTHSIVVVCDWKQAVCDSMQTARDLNVAGNRCIFGNPARGDNIGLKDF